MHSPNSALYQARNSGECNCKALFVCSFAISFTHIYKRTLLLLDATTTTRHFLCSHRRS
ncbi:hypothetical protein OIU79_006653 [Salix purpurea]|uniref:Uncharacterized protein n=1 Tax=Salix purpurea TaxID=77065 RepID=A0A9Q0Z2F8_SALPP|nr:hypothetical protein OIU79_006653 [Salix purpurea]